MKKILFATLILALAFSLNVSAQGINFYSKVLSGDPVGGALTAVSTDTALVVKYIGGLSGGGEVAVAAGGDITLTIGTVADTTTECPVSGAYAGVIDVSDASCNTLGEVCDAINFSANWRCAIVNGLRSDSSDDTLVTISASTADSKDGLALKRDTAVALAMYQSLIPSESIQSFIINGQSTPGVVPNPFAQHRTAITGGTATVTTGGAATIALYGVTSNYAKGALNAAGTGFVGGSETVRTIFSIPGAATTVEKELAFLSRAPVVSKKGEKLVLKVSATSSLTVPIISAWGSYFVD
jgi:hypothetical protein